MRAWKIGVIALCLAASAPACKALERVKGEGTDAGAAGPTGSASGGGKPATSSAATATGASTGAAAAAGAKEAAEIVPRSERAWGVAVDGDVLYWTSNSDPIKGIRKGTRAGGSPAMLCKISDMLAAPEELFVDDTHVYTLAPALGPSAVYRAAKGTTDKPCEKVATGLGLIRRGITKVGSEVFVAGGKKNGGTIVAIDKAGKSRTVLDWAKPIDGLATDGTTLFFTSVESLIDQRLMKVAPAGGTPTEIGKAGIHLQHALGRLLWVAGPLQSMPVAGGAPVRHGGSMANYTDFEIVGDTVWVGARTGGPMGNTGAIFRSTVTGGDTVEIAKVPKAVVDVAADAKDVYATGDGAVYRLAL